MPSRQREGVEWFEPKRCWRAWIEIKGRIVELGYFKLKQDAITARNIAEEKLNLGFEDDG